MRAARALLITLTSTALIATVVPTTADAATAYYGITPPTALLGGTRLEIAGPASIAPAGNRMFVSDQNGDRIFVTDLQGTVVTTITDLPAPTAMIASADGTKLYVTLREAGSIAVIDVATGAEGARLTVDACPTNIALSSGRLFYTHGCGDSPSGLASIDPAAPDIPVAVPDHGVDAPRLQARGSMLVLASNGSSDGWLKSFTTAVDGGVTETGSRSGWNAFGAARSMAISPDGTKLYSVDDYNNAVPHVFSLPGLNHAEYFDVENTSATAVTTSPGSDKVFFGLEWFNSGSATMALYDIATKATVVTRKHSTGRGLGSNGWSETSLQPIENGVAFSSDGSTTFALMGSSWSTSTSLTLLAAAATPKVTSVKVSTTPKWKASSVATATVPGVSTGTVQFTLIDQMESRRPIGTAPVKNGVASIAFKPSSETGAHVEAAYYGSTLNLPSVGLGAAKLASAVQIKMTGKNTLAKGVHTYASYKDVKVSIQLKPQTSRTKLVVIVWKWKKKRWIQEGGAKMRADENARLSLIFTKQIPGKVSVTAYFPGDDKYYKSGASSATFTMAR